MRTLILCCLIVAGFTSEVVVLRLPAGGLQPQVANDAQGGLHVVYLSGEPMASEVFISPVRPVLANGRRRCE